MYMNERGEQCICPINVVHDSESQGVWAAVCRYKGDDEFANIIAGLGFKTDQEYSINGTGARIRERGPMR